MGTKRSKKAESYSERLIIGLETTLYEVVEIISPADDGNAGQCWLIRSVGYHKDKLYLEAGPELQPPYSLVSVTGGWSYRRDEISRWLEALNKHPEA